MNEKLEQATQLNREINELSSFLELLEIGGILSPKYKKQNEFIKLEITSYVWTGSDNPRYWRSIESAEIIKELADMMLPLVRSKLSEKKLKLEGLFN